ncbi:hypothetical protein L3X39_05710 [Sabulilitoribacter multivorans]|uniref:Uncharacterized protein n=1 Tax=Flaviramulus multivorans TaxID=1304750 RepID=A0ABS9IH81_9FLAO|nr:hypothetical protein [Flaviramulus multivorans]MCF7560128.1 hypothetical protein [Flaviramulus multivorans]
MAKIEKGDVFKIKTKIGFGFLQFIDKTIDRTHYIRVLDFISQNGLISQEDVDKKERWCTEFILNIAFRRRLVEKVGNFKIPNNFRIARFARSKHIIGENINGWNIVDRNTLKLIFKEVLSDKELLLSPHGIMNDTYIIERLQEGWTLEDWK